MSEPEGRVCEDPVRHCRKEGTPEGGATAGYVFLPSYMDASRVTSKLLSFGSADSLRSYIRPVGAVRTVVRCGP